MDTPDKPGHDQVSIVIKYVMPRFMRGIHVGRPPPAHDICNDVSTYSRNSMNRAPGIGLWQ